MLSSDLEALREEGEVPVQWNQQRQTGHAPEIAAQKEITDVWNPVCCTVRRMLQII